MKQKLFTLLTLLLVVCSGAWGATITINTKSGTNGTGTWSASSGSVTGSVPLPNDLGNISFSLPASTDNSNSVSSNYVTWKKTNTLTVTMPTGVTASAIQMTFSAQDKGPANSSKNSGDVTKNISSTLGTFAKVGESTTVFSASGTATNSFTVTNTMGGEFRLTEIVLTYSTTPQSPTFSPASGIVEQGGTVSVTSGNATNIYYAWTSTESEPATPASWSNVTATAGVGSVPVPGEVTGTYYLYAYGKNSESGTIAHATYTISTPRTATTLAFVTPTTMVGVDNTVTNTPTLTPAAANEGAAFTYVSSNTDVATVDENTGEVTGVAVGTARITATYAGDATYSGSTGYYDIEVVQSAVDTKFWTSGALYSAKGGSSTYSFTGSEFIDNIEIVGSSTALTITSGSNKTIDGKTVGGRVRFNKAGTAGGNYLHFKVKPNTKITFWGVRANDSSMENGLALSIGSFGENEKVYSFEAGEPESMTYYYTGASNTDVYAYSKADAGASMMAIKVETVTTEEITPSYDKTTYVTTEKLDFTDVIGLKAYAATAASASGITMSPVGAVPVSTPLMLIGTASTTYNVPIVASADAPATNYLRAGTGAENWASIGGANYILYSDGKFHPVTSGTVATTKAYLHLDAAPSSHVLDIIFDEAGETTGIESVGKPQTTTEREVYNLAGQRVAQPTKGLYIVNGKKVVIK